MGNPVYVTVGPLAAANAALIVASNTPAAAGNLTLVGAATVTLDTPRQVLVTYGNETVARSVTIYGTNADGNAISQALTVPSGGAGTVATYDSFASVTRVAVSAAFTTNMSVGTNTIASSRWIPIDLGRNPISIALGFIVSGTVNYTLEETYDDPNAISGNIISGSTNPQSHIPAVPFADLVTTGKTATGQGNITVPFFAYRLTLNSGSGSVTMQGIQAGYGYSA